MKRVLLLVTCALLASAVIAETEPWKNTDVVQPAQAVHDPGMPLVIHVGFPVLYRASHIAASIYAGPGSKPEGIEDLKKAVAGQPRMREIILYCGCCPWDKCPNIRPAFAALHQMGYTNVKVMQIPTNLKTDWIDKGYPTDKRSNDN